MKLKSITLAAAFLTVTGLSADTQKVTPAVKPVEKAINKEKVEAIKKLLATMGAVKGNVDGAKEAMKEMKKNSKSVNPKFWDDLDKSVNASVFEELLGTVYDRYYTTDEIKAITKFYQTPAGKAFMDKNVKVSSESGHILQMYMDGQSKDLMKKYGTPATPASSPKKN